MEQTALRTHLDIFSRKTASRTEADVQVAIAAYLTISDIGLSPSQVSKVEEQLKDGTQRRIDIAYGSLVIEVKRDLKVGKVLARSVDQLEGYLQARRHADGGSYAGIITDGIDWRLYYLGSNGIEEIDSLKVDSVEEKAIENLNRWLQTILLTGERLKVTKDLIVEKLGAQSPRYKLAKAHLLQIYDQMPNKKEILTKRGLWARLLRTALGTTFEDSLDLFIDHTLLVIEAEIIAHLVLGVNPNEYEPKRVITGSIFREAGIYNVVAEDFFDWVGDSPEGREFVRTITRELQQFDWSDIEHDVLKGLYQAIIDEKTRKGLGEYYTPDWLAERVIDNLDIDWLNSRSMDPSCGSGTFIFHAVKRFIADAERAGWANSKILEKLQDSIYGLDIHPVSVVLARVTYLLAIGSERLSNRGTFTVPVYLGDSMQWTRGANMMGEKFLRVEVEGNDLAEHLSETMQTLFSSESVLDFPIRIVSEPSEFDRLVSEMSGLAQTYTDFSRKVPNVEPILKRFKITDPEEHDTLSQTFTALCTLNAEGRNHIWGYFVRNQVRPVWFSQPENRVDYLFGNPPWVAYRFMTESMQKAFKTLSQNRNLWTGGKLSTQQDLVGLFIARTTEQFLKPAGRFGFVAPFAVLSRQQYEGFRAGNWAQNAPDGLDGNSQSVRVRFDTPWALHTVKPDIFPVPSAALFGSRSGDSFPLPEKAIGFAGRPDDALSESEVGIKQLTSKSMRESPYKAVAKNGATLYPRVLIMVDELDGQGLLGGTRGITRIESFRSSLEKSPWKEVDTLKGSVESHFIFDVLLGTSIAPFRVVEGQRCVLPLKDGELLDESGLQLLAPLLAKWWNTVGSAWERHKGKSKLSIIDQINYQSKLTKQLPPPAFRVLYTKSGSNLCAALDASQSALIENKLYWVPVGTLEEGHFLTGLLNSKPLQVEVREYQSLGNYGPRDFDLLPLEVSIPRFDVSNKLHSELAAVSAQAQSEAANVDIPKGTRFTRSRKLVRERLDKEIQHRLDRLASEVLTAG